MLRKRGFSSRVQFDFVCFVLPQAVQQRSPLNAAGMQLALEEIAALWIFSYVGYGIRYATERFSSATDVLAAGSPIYLDFYANIVGCCW